ncbi:LysR family transcriptional regulator [Rhizobium sp. BK251]|uniref:LysR family transcriptional regulator n=1 Tax=Rhizobium sp. BK251 TaxID=2512125 RepID=UPI0010539CE3|nr:LysR family transcriptional regulator [Rhizobium sp. BK251]TCL76057.1 LysR family transcriptional regulator [Rhizobium sp. BK251]
MDIVAALKTFMRVAETGSFSAAALDLELTQPAVSRQVSSLEVKLNARLLHRTTNGLALTAEGERMLPLALKVLEAVEELGDTVCADAASPSGKVRLSVPVPLGLYLSDRLGAFLDANPRLAVELILRETASDLVEEGIDLEVRLGPVADSTLICRRIGWTTAHLVGSPSYLARREQPLRPEDLKEHDCICYARAGMARTWTFSSGSRDESVRVAPRLTSNNVVAVHRATLAGAGLSVLSHIVADPEIEAGRLVKLMPDYPPSPLPINVVYPSRKNVPSRVKAVLDFLVDAVRADPRMCAVGDTDEAQ